MNKFADLDAFTAVVEAGTFSAAGERLGIAKSVVSRRISQLEARLGSRLLHRTTRRLALTDAGRNFYQRAVQILADLDDAEQSVTEETARLSGSIKLAAPLSFGLVHLSNAIADFLREHPAIQLSMDLNDRNINLVEEGFDMAVRIGDLQDSTLVARRLGTVRHVTCASPEYLQKFGEPVHPDELEQHTGLQYSNISYKQQWCYRTPEGKTVFGRPQIRVRSNNGESLATAAVAGLGITTGPTFILGRYIKEHSLVTLLNTYQRPATGIHAVYPPGRLIPKRIQAFSDFLADRFGDQPHWDEALAIPRRSD
ncbi:MAG TPA: LysR family transcriptional regulator [Gammaproteobacteria bacterium]|nr:LysR family transcriptional regulator [Gammaproteobacteria bacterium]